MKFRSKPTEVEAEQYLDENAPVPGVKFFSTFDNKTGPYVTTIQGVDVPISEGEWVVREPDGVHYYPIADEVFRAKYERISEDGPPWSVTPHEYFKENNRKMMAEREARRIRESKPWWKRWSLRAWWRALDGTERFGLMLLALFMVFLTLWAFLASR